MPVERKLPIIVNGKVKTAVARAVFRPGSGKIVVDSKPLEVWIQEASQKAADPIILLPELFSNVDVYVNTSGGGPSSRSRAVMVALSRGIVKWTRSGTARKILKAYDRTALAGDYRFKEPKKFGGPGARKRFQKSYR
ncbi:MAG: 30S ribosomal protein S9 [Candidatus Brockarchaeota archaeon]|nr:30S ribosomal protein S9 [Candidatus Brockarchaeota archaeon]